MTSTGLPHKSRLNHVFRRLRGCIFVSRGLFNGARGRSQALGTGGQGRGAALELGQDCSGGGTQRGARPVLDDLGARRRCGARIGPRGPAWRQELGPVRGFSGLMESTGGSGPTGAQASKNEKEELKSRSRRRWRKAKAKGELAGWPSPGKNRVQLAGHPAPSGMTHCYEKGGARGLAHCRPAWGSAGDLL